MATIQIIDDDREFAMNIAEILLNQGHVVNIINSTNHALEELIENKPDLVILDVMFPENPVAGLELARAICRNKELESLPVLLLTSITDELSVDFQKTDMNSKWLPIHDFMEKPVTAACLLKKVTKLLKLKMESSG